MNAHTSAITILPFRMAIGFFFALVIAATAIAQLPPRTSVAMGREIRFRLTADVNPETVKISVVPQRIARARLDTDKNRFVIEGVEQGVARITFSGTSRLIAVAGPNERGTPFRHVVDVTVLPPNVRTDSRVLNYDVSKGSHKDFKLEVLMGMAFSKLNEQGYRWRNVFLSDGNTNVAEGLFDPNQLKVRISGINHGRTTIVLRGERSEDANGVWQPVVREIRVKVGTGVGPADDEPISDDDDASDDAAPPAGNLNEPSQTSEAARDEFIDAIAQRYERLSAEAKAASDQAKRAGKARELRDLIGYMETQVENEEQRRPPSAERIAKLGDLIDRAKQDLSSLEKAAANSAGGSIGEVWSEQMKTGETSKTCPANPRRELGAAQTVYFANDKYFLLSPVCLAAAHAGKITFERGGTVTWQMADITQADEQISIAQGPQPRNGVAAQVWGGSCSKCGFVFPN